MAANKQAVVVGGSVAGLLATRILSDHFEHVILVERDQFSATVEARKGTPQGRHAHAVLAKAVKIIEDLFPGFFDELEANGSIKIDMCQDMGFYHFGKWKKRFPGKIYTYFQTRNFLEWSLRQRVANIPNVSICDGTSVMQYTTDETKSRITGIQIQTKNGETTVQDQIQADLVVDVSGRGSRTPQWLEALGYPRVEEETVEVNIAYSTQYFHKKQSEVGGFKSVFVYPRQPGHRLGVILPTEDGEQWLVTLCGMFGDHPPTDNEGFIEYAKTLPVPDIYEAIKDLEPSSPVLVHKLPSNLKRCYDRMARFPEGLVVMGDAACSFNPIYGQGMTTAALEAVALGESLKQQAGNLTGMSVKFQKRVANLIAIPWLMATAEDMRYPELEERRTLPIRFLHWFTGRIHDISDEDELATLRFTEAMNMLRAPWGLFDPRLVWRALRAKS